MHRNRSILNFRTCTYITLASQFNEASPTPLPQHIENKKSAESDVAPTGIKSYKFLFVLKKNLFCSIQETDGLKKWTT